MNWIGAAVLVVGGSAAIMGASLLARQIGEWLAGPYDLNDVWEDYEDPRDFT